MSASLKRAKQKQKQTTYGFGHGKPGKPATPAADTNAAAGASSLSAPSPSTDAADADDAIVASSSSSSVAASSAAAAFSASPPPPATAASTGATAGVASAFSTPAAAPPAAAPSWASVTGKKAPQSQQPQAHANTQPMQPRAPYLDPLPRTVVDGAAAPRINLMPLAKEQAKSKQMQQQIATSSTAPTPAVAAVEASSSSAASAAAAAPSPAPQPPSVAAPSNTVEDSSPAVATAVVDPASYPYDELVTRGGKLSEPIRRKHTASADESVTAATAAPIVTAVDVPAAPSHDGSAPVSDEIAAVPTVSASSAPAAGAAVPTSNGHHSSPLVPDSIVSARIVRKNSGAHLLASGSNNGNSQQQALLSTPINQIPPQQQPVRYGENGATHDEPVRSGRSMRGGRGGKSRYPTGERFQQQQQQMQQQHHYNAAAQNHMHSQHHYPTPHSQQHPPPYGGYGAPFPYAGGAPQQQQHQQWFPPPGAGPFAPWPVAGPPPPFAMYPQHQTQQQQQQQQQMQFAFMQAQQAAAAAAAGPYMQHQQQLHAFHSMQHQQQHNFPPQPLYPPPRVGGWIAADRVHSYRNFLIVEKAQPASQQQEQHASSTLLFFATHLAGRAFHSLLDPATSDTDASSGSAALTTLLRDVIAFLEEQNGVTDYHLAIVERRADVMPPSASEQQDAKGTEVTEAASPVDDLSNGTSDEQQQQDPLLSQALAAVASPSNFHIRVIFGGDRVDRVKHHDCMSCNVAAFAAASPAQAETVGDALAEADASGESATAVVSTLLERLLHHHVWLDAQGREMIVVTPHDHIERLSDLTDEQMFALYADAYRIMQQAAMAAAVVDAPPASEGDAAAAVVLATATASSEAAGAPTIDSLATTAVLSAPLPPFVFDHLIINQGSFRNLAHLHLKARVPAHVWAMIAHAAANVEQEGDAQTTAAPADGVTAVVADAILHSQAAHATTSAATANVRLSAPKLPFLPQRYPKQFANAQRGKHLRSLRRLSKQHEVAPAAAAQPQQTGSTPPSPSLAAAAAAASASTAEESSAITPPETAAPQFAPGGAVPPPQQHPHAQQQQAYPPLPLGSFHPYPSSSTGFYGPAPMGAVHHPLAGTPAMHAAAAAAMQMMYPPVPMQMAQHMQTSPAVQMQMAHLAASGAMQQQQPSQQQQSQQPTQFDPQYFAAMQMHVQQQAAAAAAMHAWQSQPHLAYLAPMPFVPQPYAAGPPYPYAMHALSQLSPQMQMQMQQQQHPMQQQQAAGHNGGGGGGHKKGKKNKGPKNQQQQQLQQGGQPHQQPQSQQQQPQDSSQQPPQTEAS